MAITKSKSQYQEYINQLEYISSIKYQQDFPHIIAVVGNNDYWVTRTINVIKQRFRLFINSRVIFVIEDVKKDVIIAQLSERSLFKENKLFIIYNIDKYCEDLLLHIKTKSFNNYVCVVFSNQKYFQKLSQFLEEMNAFKIVIYPLKYFADYMLFINKLCEDYDISLDDDAKKFLLDRLSSDIVLIENEIKNLSLIFANQSKKLNVEDVKLSLNFFKEGDIFKIRDYILSNDINKAIIFTIMAISKGVSVLAIMSILANHCKQAITIMELIQSGKSLESTSILPSFVINKYINYVSKIKNKKFFYNILRLIYEADLKIKSSKINEELIITDIIKALSYS